MGRLLTQKEPSKRARGAYTTAGSERLSSWPDPAAPNRLLHNQVHDLPPVAGLGHEGQC